MKALVKQAKGPGNMALLDVPEPRVGPGQVKVKIAHAGICGTDVHIASGEFFHYFPPWCWAMSSRAKWWKQAQASREYLSGQG